MSLRHPCNCAAATIRITWRSSHPSPLWLTVSSIRLENYIFRCAIAVARSPSAGPKADDAVRAGRVVLRASGHYERGTPVEMVSGSPMELDRPPSRVIPCIIIMHLWLVLVISGARPRHLSSSPVNLSSIARHLCLVLIIRLADGVDAPSRLGYASKDWLEIALVELAPTAMHTARAGCRGRLRRQRF